jgi:hypothetical protein
MTSGFHPKSRKPTRSHTIRVPTGEANYMSEEPELKSLEDLDQTLAELMAMGLVQTWPS